MLGGRRPSRNRRLGESTRFIISDITTLLPGQEFRVSGNETFNIDIDTGPVFSFGFDFVEPVDGANAPFEESTFLVTLRNGASLVGSFSFERPNDSAEFVGVWTGIGESFDRVEIHETSASPGDVGENEHFGQFYTGTNAIPEPSSILTLTGLAVCFGLAGWWRKRRSQSRC